MRIIRLKEVMATTSLARSTLYKYIKEDRFPKPISLGERAVGWVEEEVHNWIMERIEKRDHKHCFNDFTGDSSTSPSH